MQIAHPDETDFAIPSGGGDKELQAPDRCTFRWSVWIGWHFLIREISNGISMCFLMVFLQK